MRGGNPAASHCASKISCRTPWIDTRPKVSVTVVNGADDIEFAGAPDFMQRERAVLAARP